MEAQALRIWKPAICCVSCLHPNDFDFNFCQRCGRRRKLQEPSSPPPYVNTNDERVANRLKSLRNFRNDKPYQRQKSSLQRQLESYLWSIPERKSLAAASPDDIVSFLTWRDKFGKTVRHSEICKKPSDGNQCSCPKSLAAGTIDSNIGKLRSILNENGRGSFWNDELRLANPAAHSSVRNYYLMILEEQTIARSFSSQAIPVFLDKLKSLCPHLRNLVIAPHAKASTRYILARDLAFFSLDFFSGDRGSDLGRLKSSDVLRPPDGKGYLINQVFGKTLRENQSNVFAVKPIPYCPVRNLDFYLSLVKMINIDLNPGYLFRVLDHHGNILNSPLKRSAVENRLKKHLRD